MKWSPTAIMDDVQKEQRSHGAGRQMKLPPVYPLLWTSSPPPSCDPLLQPPHAMQPHLAHSRCLTSTSSVVYSTAPPQEKYIKGPPVWSRKHTEACSGDCRREARLAFVKRGKGWHADGAASGVGREGEAGKANKGRIQAGEKKCEQAGVGRDRVMRERGVVDGSGAGGREGGETSVK